MRHRRHALLIGINKYPRILGNDLNGCLNDTALMSAILQQRHGFAASEITTLHDTQATQQGIRDALAGLLTRTQPDDVVILYYAGHGSRMRDRSGRKLSGYTETLVPHDSGRWVYPNRDIPDDELRDWLVTIGEKTRYVTLIFDCCHSATVHRGDVVRSVEEDYRALNESQASCPRPTVTNFDDRDAMRRWLASNDRYVVLSACRDHELAAETAVQDGAQLCVRGAFTHWLAQALAQASPRTTYRDVFERAVGHIGERYERQHPNCEGALDRLIFGNEDLHPVPYSFFRQLTASHVHLDTGRIHGAEVGTRFTLHPSAFEGDDATWASRPEVELTSVGETSAQGRLSKGDRLLPQGRATLSARPFATQWPLALSLDAARVLDPLIDDSPWLRRSETSDIPVARVELEDSHFSVLDRGGQRITPLLRQEQAATLIDVLERLAHRALVCGLTNLHSQLRGAVELSLFCRNPRDGWEPVLGVATAPLRAPITLFFQLHNRQPRVLYVALLHLTAEGSICTPLQPEHTSAELGPGLVRWFGSLSLTCPDAARLVADAHGPAPEVVCERFLLLVSTQPLDVRLLLRDPPHSFLEQQQVVTRLGATAEETPLDWIIEARGVYFSKS